MNGGRSPTLAERLANYREANGLGQEKTAVLLGVTAKTIRNLEAGQTPSVPVAKAIARLLGITLDELLANEPARASA